MSLSIRLSIPGIFRALTMLASMMLCATAGVAMATSPAAPSDTATASAGSASGGVTEATDGGAPVQGGTETGGSAAANPGALVAGSAAAPSAVDNNAAAGAPASDQLTAVVVTAQRRAQLIQNVPATVTAVTGNEVQALDLGGSAANITYLVADTSAGETAPTRPRWWIRGVGTGAQGFDVQSPVGVYFDEVYFSNVNATGQPVYDLERVEVLEGPQGTLWGKNTTGGAIDFISVKPSFTPSGYAKVDHGSYDDQLYEAAYGGPIIDGVLAARASFHSESSPGAFFDTYTGQTETRFHDDAGRLQFLAAFAQDWSSVLNLHFRDYYGDGNPWTVIGTGPGGAYYKPTPNTPNGYTPNSDPGIVAQNAPNTTQIRQDGAVLTTTGPVGRDTLTSIAGYEDFKTVAFSDGDDTPLEIQRGWNGGHTQQVSEELRLASPSTDRWNWQLGGLVFFEDINSETVTATLPDAATGDTPTGLGGKYLYSTFWQNTKSYSGFFSNTFAVTDRLNLTAGARYTNEIKADHLSLLNAGAVPGNALSPYNDVATWWLPSSIDGLQSVGVQNARNQWGNWTYDATPEYEITDHARVYFKYAHGFRAGGYNSSATSQANIDVVKPEYLTSYEVGFKSEWFGGRATLNADAFRYNYDDIQVNVVSQGVSQLTNAGAGKAHGVEFTLEAQPVSNLHLRWNQAWLDTRFTDYTTGGISYAGNSFVRSPHLTIVADADYRWPLAKGQVELATDWRYTSRYYFYSNDQVDPNVTQQGYTLGDGRLSYILGKVTFTAYVDNVTDKIYKLHTLIETNSTAPVPSNIYLGGDEVAWSEGRTFGGSFVVRF